MEPEAIAAELPRQQGVSDLTQPSTGHTYPGIAPASAEATCAESAEWTTKAEQRHERKADQMRLKDVKREKPFQHLHLDHNRRSSGFEYQETERV
jgi:hypothetical protein